MHGRESKPKAREGLLATEHSKRGRRFLTLLDPDNSRVTLLEPWEHDLLLLCDGTRTLENIAELHVPDEGAEELDFEDVVRCIKFFEKQGLVEVVGLRRSDAPPPSPKTLAQLQAAYGEWHKEPAKTGQILYPTERVPPFPKSELRVTPGLGPTVALPEDGEGEPRHRGAVMPGSTLVLAGSDSLLGSRAEREDPPDEPDERPSSDAGSMLNLLEAVDDAVREADELDRREKLKTPAPREMTETIKVVEPFVVESRPAASKQVDAPATNVAIALELLSATRETSTAKVKPPVRAEPEAVLMPTMVAVPPPVRAAAGADENTEEVVRVKQKPKPPPPDTQLDATPDGKFEESEDTVLGGMLPPE